MNIYVTYDFEDCFQGGGLSGVYDSEEKLVDAYNEIYETSYVSLEDIENNEEMFRCTVFASMNSEETILR